MEDRCVNPTAPLVISPRHRDYGAEDGELYICSTHKAVKSAMSMIDTLYPDATYEMHLGAGHAVFGLVEIPRATAISIMNKIIRRTIEFGYVGEKGDSTYNPDGTRELHVRIDVKDIDYHTLNPCVNINLTTKIQGEEY